MTLIVAIRCTNGVVVAADSAATSSVAGGAPTIRQPVRKLHILKDRVILGVSGPSGIAQQFEDRLLSLVSQSAGEATCLGANTPCAVMTRVGDAFWPPVVREFRMAQEAGIRGNPGIASAVVAAPVGDEAHLFEFDPISPEEYKTDDMPFVAIGSGQSIADPFLAFLRRVFFEEGMLPDLAMGRFAANWTLYHAIETAPAYVAGPIRMAILEPAPEPSKKRKWQVREVQPDELLEHGQHCQDAEKWLKKFGAELHADGNASEPPEPCP